VSLYEKYTQKEIMPSYNGQPRSRAPVGEQAYDETWPNHAALIIVDMQNDFMDHTYYKTASLPVNGADAGLIARVLDYFHAETTFGTVVVTKDWHPEGHVSFAETHAKKQGALPASPNAWTRDQPNDEVGEFKAVSINYTDHKQSVNQMLWPKHCVQGSTGAAIVAELQQAMNAERDRPCFDREYTRTFTITKGDDVNVDSNSAVVDARGADVSNTLKDLAGIDSELTLCELLKQRKITDVYCVGVALDYCVIQTAHGLETHLKGVNVHVLLDATRAVNPVRTADD
jgi:nicotinamidase-related amidase